MPRGVRWLCSGASSRHRLLLATHRDCHNQAPLEVLRPRAPLSFEGGSVRKSASFVLACALVAGLIATVVPAGASARTPAFDARRYLKEHGYLPLRGVATLEAAKAHAAAVIAAQNPNAPAAPSSVAAPIIGPSWHGTSQGNLTPPDGNGATGP